MNQFFSLYAFVHIFICKKNFLNWTMIFTFRVTIWKTVCAVIWTAYNNFPFSVVRPCQSNWTLFSVGYIDNSWKSPMFFLKSTLCSMKLTLRIFHIFSLNELYSIVERVFFRFSLDFHHAFSRWYSYTMMQMSNRW